MSKITELETIPIGWYKKAGLIEALKEVHNVDEINAVYAAKEAVNKPKDFELMLCTREKKQKLIIKQKKGYQVRIIKVQKKD